jgi:hypothetical protein
MKYQRNALNATAALILLMLSATVALGQCNVANLKDPAQLTKTSLVIDVRPDQINQFRGKTAFREQAHIFLTNMNPFLFGYRIQVAQTEVQDTGFLNFLNLLGSPVSDIIGSPASVGRSAGLRTTGGGSLELLIARTNEKGSVAFSCKLQDAGDTVALRADAGRAIDQLADARQRALGAMADVKGELDTRSAEYANARAAFLAQKNIIFNSSVEASSLCDSANTLFTGLTAPVNAYPTTDTMTDLMKKLADFKSLVGELESSARDYKTEYENCPSRTHGVNYPDNLIRLAGELRALATAYETKVNALTNETKGYDALVAAIKRLSGRESQTLQREYTVFGQYDISALDITVTPEPLGTDSGLPVQKDLTDRRFDVVGSTQSTGGGGNVRIINAGADDLGGIKVFTPRGRAASVGADGGGDKGEDGGGEKGGGGGGSAGGGGESDSGKEIKHNATIGWRRFELSGGMAFSSLDKREFQPVLGYGRNEQGVIVGDDGQPTDKRELTTIVGISEDSGRRISPIAMLHYRMPYVRSVFASVGVTGKRDNAGTDLEYLLGPSFLFRNMFVTLGGYAGKQQRLAGDLFLGAKLPGTTVPVQKDYRWGLGFSFTYKVPLGKPKTEH